MVSYFLDKLMFHRSTQEAAICALFAGSPTIVFLGFAVLDPIYGNNTNTNLVIGIVSIVVNAITIPLGLTLINKGQDKLKQRVAAKKGNGSTQVEIKLGQKVPRRRLSRKFQFLITFLLVMKKLRF
ncbi:hypothetical protein IMAU30003_00440 [Lactobacillus helveticus]|uniref:Uncharacterized protein n=1 Tax=Lactobacillus helveticus TaxID=1587 RepID=A0A9Q5C0E7_LACHE|nr:hypothetical protein [Lactobacillus helveticus]